MSGAAVARLLEVAASTVDPATTARRKAATQTRPTAIRIAPTNLNTPAPFSRPPGNATSDAVVGQWGALLRTFGPWRAALSEVSGRTAQIASLPPCRRSRRNVLAVRQL